jgi:protein MpaA
MTSPNTAVASPAIYGADKRDPNHLLLYFNNLVETSRHLLGKSTRNFEIQGEQIQLSRFVWSGPAAGNDPFRLGLFATINGDEPEGALALARLINSLERDPDPARGYVLYLYPVCNPTGFADKTRLSRAGNALNRLFWTGSSAPEVRFLESEIWMQAFHGIINLRSDADSEGLYGFASGSVLSESLLEPALQAAETFLPRNRRRQIEGTPARRGIVYSRLYSGSAGSLGAVPGLQHPPFEIVLTTPRSASIHRQVEAQHAALSAILAEFRYLQAIAQNI